jgi:hypothetical protein
MFVCMQEPLYLIFIIYFTISEKPSPLHHKLRDVHRQQSNTRLVLFDTIDAFQGFINIYSSEPYKLSRIFKHT